MEGGAGGEEGADGGNGCNRGNGGGGYPFPVYGVSERRVGKEVGGAELSQARINNVVATLPRHLNQPEPLKGGLKTIIIG